MSLLFLVLSLAFSAVVLFRSGRLLVGGSRSFVLVAHVGFGVFFVLPVLVDLVAGPPRLGRFPTMQDAFRSTDVTIVYALFLVYVQTVFYFFTRTRRAGDAGSDPLVVNRIFQVACWIILFLPVMLALVGPDPSIYLKYSPFARGLAANEDLARFHVYVSRSVQFALIAGGVLLLTAKKAQLLRVVIFVSVGMGAACWMNGKRNAVAFALVIIVFTLYRRGVLTGKRLVGAVGLVTILFFIFSAYYQEDLRFSTATSENRSISDIGDERRIDFARDAVMRLSIYSALDDDIPSAISYPGQSVSLLVSSVLGSGSQKTYPNRVTSLAFASESLGRGGVTTSVYDEMLANFGFLGLAFAPFIVVAIAVFGGSSRSELGRVLTLFAVIAVQLVYLTAWLPVFIVWFVVIVATCGTFDGHRGPVNGMQTRGITRGGPM